MHNDFTLFKRVVPSGKKVVYYYAYDENDVRQGPWTTKCLTATEARNYCHKLIKAGTLLPSKKNDLTFGCFAVDFWDYNSEYLKYQRSRNEVTEKYINICKGLMVNQILPFFRNTPLEK